VFNWILAASKQHEPFIWLLPCTIKLQLNGVEQYKNLTNHL